MKRATTFSGHEGQVLDLVFTPESRTLVSAGMDNHVKLWSTSNWEALSTLQGHEKSVNSLALSPDGETLVTGSSDATVKLWNLPEREVMRTLQDRKQVVSTVTLSANGRWVVAGSYGGRAAVWTIDGEDVVVIKASNKNLSSVAVSRSGALLATAGLGDTVSVWKLPSGSHLETLSGHKTAVSSLRFIDEDRQLVSLGYEGTIRLWGQDGWEEQVIAVGEQGPRRLVLSADEEKAALSLEGRIQLWKTGSWERSAELEIETKAVGGLAFSPDGVWFAAGGADGRIRVWSMS